MREKVGHNPLNIMKIQINQFELLENEFKKNPDAFQSIVSLSKHMGYDYTPITGELMDKKHEINSFIKSCSNNYDLTENEIDYILSEITQCHVETTKIQESIRLKLIDMDQWLANLIEQTKNLEMWIIEEADKTQLEEEEKKIVIEEKMKELKFPDMSEKSQNFFVPFTPILYLLFGSYNILTYLSIIITAHEQKSRYPDEKSGFNPMTYYTKDSLLIKRLPQMQKYSGVVIEWMEEMYQLLNSFHQNQDQKKCLN
ncbi:hypothetical protein [uncultured Methanocorpusculum sp.]|nr:hypothetical protein [uncultured Methanocorpusculum sp.]